MSEDITGTITEDITATAIEDIIVITTTITEDITATVADGVDDLAIVEAGCLAINNDGRLSTLPTSLCRPQGQPGEVCLPGRLGPALTLLWA